MKEHFGCDPVYIPWAKRNQFRNKLLFLLLNLFGRCAGSSKSKSKSSGQGGISIGGARSAAPRGIIFGFEAGFTTDGEEIETERVRG